MENNGFISEEEYLNKAKDFKNHKNAPKDLCEAFFAFTERYSILQIQPEHRIHTITELMKMYKISNVDPVELIDIFYNQALSHLEWDEVRRRICQSCCQKALDQK